MGEGPEIKDIKQIRETGKLNWRAWKWEMNVLEPVKNEAKFINPGSHPRICQLCSRGRRAQQDTSACGCAALVGATALQVQLPPGSQGQGARLSLSHPPTQSTRTSASVPLHTWMEECGGVEDARNCHIPNNPAGTARKNKPQFFHSQHFKFKSLWENRLGSKDFFFLPPLSSISNVKQIEDSSEGLKNQASCSSRVLTCNTSGILAPCFVSKLRSAGITPVKQQQASNFPWQHQLTCAACFSQESARINQFFKHMLKHKHTLLLQ